MRRAASLATAAALGVFVSSAAMATPKPLPLRDRVIRPGEFPGFVRQRPVLFKSVKRWVSTAGLTAAEAARWTATLRRDGFRAALREDLLPETGSDRAALSWVVRFRSAAAARSEVGTTMRLAAIINKKPGRSHKTFQVDAIPGARGIHDTGPHGVGENIVFSDGPFLYLVGNRWDTGATNPPTRARLLAAAIRLYKRVRGHPAP